MNSLRYARILLGYCSPNRSLLGHIPLLELEDSASVAITNYKSHDEKFRINLVKGQIAKEMVRALLENSGYRIYAFGYESLLSQLRYDVKNQYAMPKNDSNNRLRSTPDLLGYDEQNRLTYFIEVKFSSSDSPKKVRLSVRSLRHYQRYWNDSVIVIVIPTEHIFYVQEVRNLKLEGLIENEINYFDLEQDLRPIEGVFHRVRASDSKSFYSILKRFEMLHYGVNMLDTKAEEIS